MDNKRVLVVAPHPDDEILGCGGTMAMHARAQADVYLCIVTETYSPDWSETEKPQRHTEVCNSCEVLGIKEAFFLGLPTVKLDTISQKELNDKLAAVVDNIQPDIIYIPYGKDPNKDHRLIFDAMMVVGRPCEQWTVEQLLCYETLSETEWAPPANTFMPNIYVDITETMRLKLKAMEEYKLELKKPPHPRSLEGIKALAKVRGATIGVEYAEAFMMIRGIWKGDRAL